MFDPTIYENLKVVLEGLIYDADLNDEIEIMDRRDVVVLSTLAREYSVQFKLKKGAGNITAITSLIAKAEDLAGEVLGWKQNEAKIGCRLEIEIWMNSFDLRDAGKIEERLNTLWNHRPMIIQEISYLYPQHWDESEQSPERYFNRLKLDFQKKLDEGNVSDLATILQLTMESLRLLER